MNEIPCRAHLNRPFIAINGVNLSRHVKQATVDRTDETITIDFFGPRSYPQLEYLTKTMKPVELELRKFRKDRSPDNPAFIMRMALLYDWDEGKATFRDAAAGPMMLDRIV